jgi:catechol 2,3-dioxygenase-like lactoylglutathione lyase family enzyme
MKNRTLLIAGLILSVVIICGFRSLNSPVHEMSIGVIVSDLDKSYDFYTKIIGMTDQERTTYHQSSETSTKYGVNSGKEFNIARLKLKCDGYNMLFKLNKTVDNLPDKPFSNENDYYGFEKIGSSYYSIDVKDVDPYIERLEENNIKHMVARLPNDYIVVLVHDPDGIMLEI